MKTKIWILPLLLVGVTLAWAFRPLEPAGKMIRTKDGAVIIPSSVKMRPEDRRFLVQTLRSAGDYGALAWVQDGKMRTYGSYDMQAFRQVSQQFGVDMKPQEGIVTGVVIFKKKIFKDKKGTPNKFDEKQLVISKAWITASDTKEVGDKLADVINRYAD